MTHPAFDHGRRLTDDEYERRIVGLYRDRTPLPNAEQDRWLRRRELDLAIDHRLGVDFPVERREALWAVRERVERRRLRLGLRYLVRWLVPRLLARGAQKLATAMVDEYATVLSPAELSSFFNLAEGEAAALPIDLDQIRKS